MNKALTPEQMSRGTAEVGYTIIRKLMMNAMKH